MRQEEEEPASSDLIHNPYKQDFKGSLIQILKKRNLFVAEPAQREKVYSGASTDKQKLIDSIFGMQPKDIDERFTSL